MEQTLEKSPPVMSLEIAKASLSMELQRNGFAALQTKADTLVVNEDNLEEVQQFVSKVKGLLKIVDAKHAQLKEPHLRAGQIVDEAKRGYVKTISDILTPINQKYTDVCRQIEQRVREQEAENRRKSEIKQGIENNILLLSQQIAACETIKDLIEVEKKINLQKGANQGKAKYQEFLPDWINRLNGLTEMITSQKDKVRKMDALRASQVKAEEHGDEDAIMEIADKLTAIETSIEEAKIVAQEDAINSAVQGVHNVQEVATIFPTVKARRTSWKYKISDINKLQKKMPHLVKLVPDEDAIDALLKTKKLDGSLQEGDWFGINFYQEKLF